MFRVELNADDQYRLNSYMAKKGYTGSDTKYLIAKNMKENKCKSKTKCSLFPGYGKFKWQHNDDEFIIEYYEEGKAQGIQHEVKYFNRLYIYHDDAKKISDFLENAFNDENDDNKKSKIYVSKCGGYDCFWEEFNDVNFQSIDTVFIDKEIKATLLDCIDKFIASKDKYDKYGKIHKLNLLFTGIPGSGKTTLCKALAKHYGFSIYSMNLNKNVKDEHIISLTSNVKENSIILYEDIDTFFTQRNSTDVNVTFSSIINILDGTLSKGSGVINIITTNFPDKLDAALLRPGRVDKIIQFDYPKKEDIKNAFVSLIGNDQHFDEWFAHIKNRQVSMAVIIDYLFRNSTTYLVKENIQDLISQIDFVKRVTKEDNQTKLYS